MNNVLNYFSTNEKNYQLILPINTGVCIPENDPVFLLKEICHQLNYSRLMSNYSTRGRNSKVSPQVMFTLIVYAYMNGVFSSREIERLCKRDIYYMFITDNVVIDHTTITRFRSKRLMGAIDDLFNQLISILVKNNEINFNNIFIDGTKIEANANRYTFVQKKTIDKNLNKLIVKINNLISDINSNLNKNYTIENDNYIETLNLIISELPIQNIDFVSGKGKKKTNIQKYFELINEYKLKLTEYYENLNIIGDDRNSMSKTDHDATFMHMKEDHMRNSQLKPAYNLQYAIQNEYILSSYISNDRNDNKTLIPFLNKMKKDYGINNSNIVADSGYFSEENLCFCLNNDLIPFIKPTYFDKMKFSVFKNNPFKKENFKYNEKKDVYVCPNNKKLKFIKINKTTLNSGFIVTSKIYQCSSCKKCKLKDNCTKSKIGRTIQINDRLNELTTKCYDRLNSELGKTLRMNRSIQSEGAFAQMKFNDDFNRFLLRGTSKVQIEILLYAFAYNIKKLASKFFRSKLGEIIHALKLS